MCFLFQLVGAMSAPAAVRGRDKDEIQEVYSRPALLRALLLPPPVLQPLVEGEC